MLSFSKMQGAGNDFIIIDNRQTGYRQGQLQQIARRVCQRKISVGSDALMVVDHPTDARQADLRMRFFNADGSEAEMCGNGARCLARYAYEHKIAGESMVIETMAGFVPAWRLSQRKYKVQLNPPSAYETDLPVSTLAQTGELPFLKDIAFVDYVALGEPAIPHLVVHLPLLTRIADLSQLKPLAQALRHWSRLPKGANVNFFALPDSSGEPVLVRTYERGVEDFTLACGTGSGSVAYALVQRGLATSGPDQPVALAVPGGLLEVEVTGPTLNLMGDTNLVVQGQICDEDLVIAKSEP